MVAHFKFVKFNVLKSKKFRRYKTKLAENPTVGENFSHKMWPTRTVLSCCLCCSRRQIERWNRKTGQLSKHTEWLKINSHTFKEKEELKKGWKEVKKFNDIWVFAEEITFYNSAMFDFVAASSSNL